MLESRVESHISGCVRLGTYFEVNANASVPPCSQFQCKHVYVLSDIICVHHPSSARRYLI